jgi:serine/threonine-protein kinase RsbW
MKDQLFLVVPCDLRYRDAIGALVQKICHNLEQHGEESGFTFQVLSAFNEAFNNLAQYAAAGSTEIEIMIQISEQQLILEFKDHGPPFSYQDVQAPRLEDLPESGLGIFIMRSFMSEICYIPGVGGEKNTLRMIKKLKRGESSSQPHVD